MHLIFQLLKDSLLPSILETGRGWIPNYPALCFYASAVTSSFSLGMHQFLVFHTKNCLFAVLRTVNSDQFLHFLIVFRQIWQLQKIEWSKLSRSQPKNWSELTVVSTTNKQYLVWKNRNWCIPTLVCPVSLDNGKSHSAFFVTVMFGYLWILQTKNYHLICHCWQYLTCIFKALSFVCSIDFHSEFLCGSLGFKIFMLWYSCHHLHP
jgi:hypothetical protein